MNATKAAKLIITLLAGALCAGTAMAAGHAQKPAKTPPPVDEFKALDTNHDGKISKEEFLAGGDKGGTAEEFDKLDKNHDGFLDHSEFSQRHKKH